MENLKILITGAGGFIGRYTVDEARAAGHEVVAVVRNTATVPSGWTDDSGIVAVGMDLTAPESRDELAKRLSDCGAIIHAAAIMHGPTDLQISDNAAVTDSLLSALAMCSPAPRLVLVSSLSVYDGQALAQGAMLSEESPLEATPLARDAYCQSKLMQEKQARDASDTHGFELWIVRPGAVFGPGRLWNGHLGHPIGPVLIGMESDGEVPLSYVDHTAQALVQAATTPGNGFEVVNVIDDDRPTRSAYIQTLRTGGWPRVVVPISWRLLNAIGTVLGKAPGLAVRLPGLLRPATLQSRMKPLRFDTTIMHDRLNIPKRPPFSELMTRALKEEPKL